MIKTYSFLSEGYDVPQNQERIFTDKDVDLFKDPTRNARMVKILSHLFVREEWSLWMDADIELLVSPEEILNKYKDRGDIVFMKHRFRDCAYDEAIAVISGGRDTNRPLIQEQVNTYLMDHYPKQNGLFETGVILRRNTVGIQELNEFWWAQNCRYSKRDQLSINYSVWKLGIEVGMFDDNFDTSKEFKIHGHQPNSKLLPPQGSGS